MKKLCAILSFAFIAAMAFSPHSLPAQQPSPPQQQNAHPQWLVVRILQAAQPHLYAATGLHLGQLIQAYRNEGLEIEFVCRDETDACKGLYRVSVGGTDVIVAILDGL